MSSEPQGAPPDPGDAHLDNETLLREILLMLTPVESQRVNAHLSRCRQCQVVYEGMRMGFELALESDDDPNSPADPATRPNTDT